MARPPRPRPCLNFAATVCSWCDCHCGSLTCQKLAIAPLHSLNMNETARIVKTTENGLKLLPYNDKAITWTTRAKVYSQKLSLQRYTIAEAWKISCNFKKVLTLFWLLWWASREHVMNMLYQFTYEYTRILNYLDTEICNRLNSFISTGRLFYHKSKKMLYSAQ